MALLQRAFSLFTRTFEVRGNSMEPTLADRAAVQIDPFAFASRLPQRGDIVSIRSPSSPDRFELKRLIGLPGEEVSWLGSDFWINGSPLEEKYALKAPCTPGDEPQRLLLGRGEYFVAGDNRLRSRDSRMYGAILDSKIIGKVLAGHTHV